MRTVLDDGSPLVRVSEESVGTLVGRLRRDLPLAQVP